MNRFFKRLFGRRPPTATLIIRDTHGLALVHHDFPLEGGCGLRAPIIGNGTATTYEIRIPGMGILNPGTFKGAVVLGGQARRPDAISVDSLVFSAGGTLHLVDLSIEWSTSTPGER